MFEPHAQVSRWRVVSVSKEVSKSFYHAYWRPFKIENLKRAQNKANLNKMVITEIIRKREY